MALLTCSDKQMNIILKNLVSVPYMENINVTTSCGVTKICCDKHVDTLIAEADKLLYEAKEQGRNRIVLWDGRVILSK